MKISRVFISALCLCVLPLVVCYSQQSKAQQVENQADFTGGLNTKYPSNFIGPTQTQDAQNVFFDDGSLKKRKGHAKQNNTAIGGGNHDVTGLYEYNKADGTQYCVSFSSASGYVSTDRCASNTVFISTLTADQEVNCVPFTDRLYCVNGVDTPLYLSGTTYTLVPEMPACKYIRVYQNRLWCAGASAQKSYIYYSNVGDGDNWDTTFNWVALNPEDGDVITGLGEPIYETLPAYKRYSSWIVQGKSASNYTPVMVSNSIGATHHRTIRNLLLNDTKTIQAFGSNGIRGGEPGVYSFNGIVVQYLSDAISNKFEVMDSFKVSDRFKTFDSASDWLSGASVYIDSYTASGSIQNEVWSDVDTSSTNFLEGTLSGLTTSYVEGALALDYFDGAGATLLDDFSDGNFISSPIWTTDGNAEFSASGNNLAFVHEVGNWGTAYTPLNVISSEGTWSESLYIGGYGKPTGLVSAYNYTFDFINSATDGTGNGYYILFAVSAGASGIPSWAMYLGRKDSGVQTVLGGISCSRSGSGVGPYYIDGTLTITRATGGVFTVYHTYCSTITATDATYNATSGYMRHYVLNMGNDNSMGNPNWAVDNINIPLGFNSTGTFTSRIFNTGFSTSPVSAPAVGGPFTVTYSTPAGSNVWFYTRSSTSPNNDNWGAWEASSDSLKIASTQQYWQYKADFQTSYSTQTPVVYDVTLYATSTGTWTSPETYLDNLIGSWGLFQSVELTTGTASWTYEMRSSTYSGGTASASWGAVTNNTIIGISPGAYVQVRAKTTLNSSTDTARIDIITINYFIGSAAKSACAEVYRNRYYWFGQDRDGTENNVGYVMDSNGAWTKLVGINARSTALISGEFYTGDSIKTNGGFIRKQDTGYSDSGSDIESYWQSKDYLFNSDDYLKTVDNVFLTFPNNNATVTTSLYADGSLSKSWDVNVSTSQPFGVKGLPVATASGNKRAKYFNVKFSNTSTDPWEILGYRLYWTTTQALQP